MTVTQEFSDAEVAMILKYLTSVQTTAPSLGGPAPEPSVERFVHAAVDVAMLPIRAWAARQTIA